MAQGSIRRAGIAAALVALAAVPSCRDVNSVCTNEGPRYEAVPATLILERHQPAALRVYAVTCSGRHRAEVFLPFTAVDTNIARVLGGRTIVGIESGQTEIVVADVPGSIERASVPVIVRR